MRFTINELKVYATSYSSEDVCAKQLVDYFHFWQALYDFLFLPEGDTAGDFQLSGTGIVTGISQSQSYDGLVERSFTVQGTGALTIGTI